MVQRILRYWVLLLVLVCVISVGIAGQVALSRLAASPQGAAAELQCGHWSVYRCSWLLGAPVGMKEIVKMLPHDGQGHTLGQLKESLERIGFTVEGRRESIDSFLAGSFPCIVHLKNPDHFLVAFQQIGRTVLVFSPSGKRLRVSVDKLEPRWTGYLLRVWRPGDAAVPAYVLRPRDNAPCVQFDALYQDAGNIAIDQQSVRFDYTIRNLGAAPLTVKKVHVDCRCLEAQKPEFPIPPGGKETITLEYRNPGQWGIFKREAVVETNDPTYPIVPLIAVGNTGSRVTFEPRSLNLGEVARGESRTAYVFVHFYGDDTNSFDLSQLECTLPGVSVRTIGFDEFPKGGRLGSGLKSTIPTASVRIIEVRWQPTAIPESESAVGGWLKFKATGPGGGEFRLPIVGRVVPPVAITPTAFNFGEVRKNTKSVSAAIVLRSRTNQPFRVVRIETCEPGITTRISDSKPEKEITVELVCDGKTALNFHRSQVNAVISIEGQDRHEEMRISIPVYAWRDFTP